MKIYNLNLNESQPHFRRSCFCELDRINFINRRANETRNSATHFKGKNNM